MVDITIMNVSVINVGQVEKLTVEETGKPFVVRKLKVMDTSRNVHHIKLFAKEARELSF